MKIILLAAFVISNLVPVPFTGQKTIAFLTEIKGTVKIRPRGKPEAKVSRTEVAFLFDGDTISTGDDGEALLWQAYSRVVPIKPKTSKEISKLPPSSEPEVLNPNRYLELETLAIASLRDVKRQSPRRQGAAEEQYFIALSPRYSVALSTRPTFEWTSAKNATSYDFALYDANQNEIWKKNLKETRLTYPDQKEDKNARKLTPGEYAWEVTANVDQNTKKYDAAEFTLVSAEEASKVQTALLNARTLVEGPSSTNLIYIAACLVHKQYPEAEKELRAALVHNPDQQMIRALLMQVYELMRRPDEREDLRVPFKNSDLLEIGSKFRVEGLLKQE